MQTNSEPPAPSGEVESSNPFVCNTCKRSYSRLDHLARHYRSHTREKPFSCRTCGKTFSRADLVKRHEESHHDGDEPKMARMKRRNTGSSQQSSRVFQACEACASAKLKCGDEKPCRRCQQSGIECITPPSSRKVGNSLHNSTSTTNIGNLYDTSRASTQERINHVSGDHQRSLSEVDIEQHQNNLLGMFTPQEEREIQRTISSEAPAGLGIPPIQPDDESMLDLDDSSLAEFLRDIMIPNTSETLAQDQQLNNAQQTHSRRDVFDFGIDSSLDFDDMDFNWINAINMQAPNFNLPYGDGDQQLTRGQQTPDIRNGMNLGAEAFQNSLWRWAPAIRDTGYAEQENLLLPCHDIVLLELNHSAEAPEHGLEQSSRDHILAMLLGTCDPANVSRVVSSFPSTQMLSSLVHLYFKSQASSADSWIHHPTFRPNQQRAELNAILVSAGAVSSSIPAVRKLGFALQEAVRLAIPKVFESDNRTTRDLQLLQAYALNLSVMIWSGNKRKMEIAESHAQPLITMLRRASRYRRARSSYQAPQAGDSDEVLDNKWHQWAEGESLKRLAFHTLIHDSQTSVAFLVHPLVSYAEVSLELPCSQAMWQARDCYTWKDAYLDQFPDQEHRLPSLLDCIHDTQPLLRAQSCTDFQMSTSIILHAIWGLIAEYRQLEHASKIQGNRPWNSVLTSWHRELCQLLDNFRITMSECEQGMHPETVMFQELCMMNLHVSFEQLQIFAGKEGSEEAQKVYPLLTVWKDNRESRQAMWHAGQIIRAATACHPSYLRGFCAIALYHASLAFWVFGMISLGTSQRHKSTEPAAQIATDDKLVWLDDEETAKTRRWIAIQRGIPAIHSFPRDGESSTLARLDNPKAVMDIIIKVLSKKSNGEDLVLSPLVENLIQLMRGLASAAWVIGSH